MPSRMPHAFRLSCLLTHFGLWPFPRLPLFCRTPSTSIRLRVSSGSSFSCDFGEEELRGQVPLSSHPIKDMYFLHDYPCWRWPWSLGWGHFCQVSPLLIYSLPVATFPYCTLWREECSTMRSPHLKNEDLQSTFWGWGIYINYLELFWMRKVLLLSHLFI